MIRHALALLIVIPFTLQAQSESGHAELSRAIAAYQNLDFDLAATTLRRALQRELSVSDRIEALTYLGAAEHYRARPDSARAVFQRLILLAPPGFQLDTLVFPPEVTHAFESVQLAVRDTLRQGSLAQVTPPPPPPPTDAPPAVKPETNRQRPAQPARSHREIGVTGGGVVANVRTHSEGGLPSASGMALGVAGAARLGRFELGIEYL
jgi:tetratricopeptide (TPR) repeat protein